jgi:hypothetical protein
VYEGHFDEAEALWQSALDAATANGDKRGISDASEELGHVRLLKGALAGAAKAAKGVSLGIAGARREYDAANLLVETGTPGPALDAANDWATREGSDGALAAALVQGDAQRKGGRIRDAIATCTAALRVQDLWLVHERLGRAYV